MALLLSEWLLKCGVEWNKVPSRLMWVRVQIERESWVFIAAYGSSSERSEEMRRCERSLVCSANVSGILVGMSRW